MAKDKKNETEEPEADKVLLCNSKGCDRPAEFMAGKGDLLVGACSEHKVPVGDQEEIKAKDWKPVLSDEETSKLIDEAMAKVDDESADEPAEDGQDGASGPTEPPDDGKKGADELDVSKSMSAKDKARFDEYGITPERRKELVAILNKGGHVLLPRTAKGRVKVTRLQDLP